MGKKRVLICGAGSIGIYLGAKLHSNKHSVKLFGRKKLRGINDIVIIDNKKFEVPEKSFSIQRGEEHDFVFLTSKLYDLDKIVKILKNKKIKGEIFVGIQNGLVDVSKYHKILGKKITPIVVFSGFNLKGSKIFVTPTPTGWITEDSKDGRAISKFLLDEGIPCKTDKRFDSLRAEKTIINCCLNGLSAIENKPFCELFKNKNTKERIDRLFEECYNILKKMYKLDNFDRMKKRMFNHWSKLKHYSSTHQDIYSKRKNEIPYFNGYLVELGKKQNMPTEQNQAIIKEINKIAKK